MFSTPILSVAADAVRDLEGRDALSSLWTIFTKCKGSLQNGRRLENITWRLWHRELRTAEDDRSQSLPTDSSMSEKDIDNEKAEYTHLTQSEVMCFHVHPPSEMVHFSEANTSAGAMGLTEYDRVSPRLLSGPFSSNHTLPCPSSWRNINGTSLNVGQIICDLLPTSSSCTSKVGSLPSEGYSLDKSWRLSSENASVQPDWQETPVVTPVTPFHPDVQPTSISLKPSGYVQPNAISYLTTSDAEVIDLMLPVIQLSSSSQTPQRPISLRSSSSITPQDSSFSNLAPTLICSNESTPILIPTHELNKPQASSYQAAPFPRSLPELTETSHPAQVVLPPSHPLSLQSSTANVTPQTPTIGLEPLQPQFTDGLLSQPPQLVVVNPTPNPTPHPTPPTTPLISGVSGSNRQQWLSLPRLGDGSSSRRERLSSLAAPVLLPPSTIGGLDHEEVPVLSTDEMDQPIIVHLPSNALNVNGSMSRGVSSLGQLPLPLPMSQQATNHGQEQDALARDSTDRSSISSVTSDLSHVTSGTSTSNSSRTTGGTTLSASSSGVGGGEEKTSTLIDISLSPIQPLGNVALGHEKRPGSLSINHSSSMLADRGRKERITLKAVGDSNSEKVTANVDAEVIEVEGHSAYTSELKSSISARRVVKRNSSPVPFTSVLPLTLMSPSSVTQCPSGPPVYAAGHHAPPLSPDRSVSSDSSGLKQATVTETSGNMSRAMSSDRISSRSRSIGGSSTKESRSRSREHSAAPIVGLSGIGTLGGLGMTIAAAYPPPAVIRKQVAVGAGKGRVKVAFGRAVGGKARAIVRRNSAGPGVEIGGKVYQEAKPSETPKAEMEGVIQNDGKEALQHQGSVYQFQTEQLLALITEEHTLAPSTGQPSIREGKSIFERSQDVNGANGIAENNYKRPPRFNIGSNSDEGSGAGSKSVGSGSSMSVGHSIDQRLRTIMGGDVVQDRKAAHVLVNEMKLGALLLHAQERQQRKVETKDHQRLGGQRGLQHHNCQARETSRSLSKQETRHLKETERLSEKAKGKVQAVDLPAPSASKPSSKNKSKSTPNLGTLDPVLAAKLRDSLAEPLLPKGRPVVVDTESDYETESDDGSWSSEEISDDAGARKQEQIKRESALKQEQEKDVECQRQETLLRQMHQQPQQQSPPQQQQRNHHNFHDHNHNIHQNPVRPAGVQRTHSSHYPATNHGRISKAAAQRSRQQQVSALHHAKLEQAAKEAQRQREMIKKIPTESLQDLAKARANSVGLLSQLLNPNPDNFPPSHPYRRGASSGAIRPPSELMSAIHLTTSEPGPTPKPVAKPNSHNPISPPDPNPRPLITGVKSESPTIRRHVSTDRGNRRTPSLTSPIRAPPMQLMKGGAGVSSQIQAGSIATKGAPSVAMTSKLIPDNLPTTGSGGYRPKGPPKDQEMEEDSDSEPDIGKIQVSESVAEQKLKALVAKRGIRQKQAAAQPQAGPSKRLQGDEDVPDWARVSQPDPDRHLHNRRTLNGLQFTSIARPVPTAPIPLGHPYNLPPPAPPTTPRTTRRQMLSTELSESLRRNLLWERQVSKSNLSAMKRSSSGGGSRRNALTGLQPFTGMPRVVQLHAKGTIPPDQQSDPAQLAVGVVVTEDERDEMRKHAMARNRSWANDYHYSGW